MQFQRLQSLYIFLAAVAMFIFCFAPCGQTVIPEGVMRDPVLIYPGDFFGIFIPAVLAGFILVVSLFLFKSLHTQYQLVLVSLLFTVCTAGLVTFTLFKGFQGDDSVFTVWDVTLIAALVLEVAAMGRIRHDRKLLASYNRLR